jgi:FixJ family two-component response regulator
MPERRLRKEPVISIVDDDQFVRDSLKRLMKSFGYKAAAYPSANDFLKSPQVEETSCLIADVHMPGVTGVELYEHLVRTGCAMPTILITAYPDDRVRTRALDRGVLAYLVKPFSETELTRHVRFALAERLLSRGKSRNVPGAASSCKKPDASSSE